MKLNHDELVVITNALAMYKHQMAEWLNEETDAEEREYMLRCITTANNLTEKIVQPVRKAAGIR